MRNLFCTSCLSKDVEQTKRTRVFRHQECQDCGATGKLEMDEDGGLEMVQGSVMLVKNITRHTNCPRCDDLTGFVMYPKVEGETGPFRLLQCERCDMYMALRPLGTTENNMPDVRIKVDATKERETAGKVD